MPVDALGWVPGRTSREVPLSAMAAQPPAQGLLVPGTVTESRSNCQYARRVTFTLHQHLHARHLAAMRTYLTVWYSLRDWQYRAVCHIHRGFGALQDASHNAYLSTCVTRRTAVDKTACG